jgi:hypothetical protein
MKRDKAIIVRVSASERSEAKDKADKAGLSMNGFIRFLIKSWNGTLDNTPKRG